MRNNLFLSFFTFAALFTSCAAVGFTRAINGASEINNGGNATSGFNFQLDFFYIGQADIDLTAENTYAKAKNEAVSGISGQIAGDTTGDGESVSSLDFKTYDTTSRSRKDDAIAGIEINAQDLEDAPFDVTFVADGNTAVQRGKQDGTPDAVAGVEFNIYNIVNSRSVFFNTTVRNNYAKSAADDAEAGAEFALYFDVTNTSLFFIDEATNNVAKAQDDAVAGIERNVFGTVSGDDVSIDVISNAQNNIAESKTEDAYAGIENDFIILNGAKLNFNSYAKNNTAKGDSLVIAGVQNELNRIYNTNQNNVISSTAKDNFANSEDEAIAGVKNDVTLIQNSTIVFDSQSGGNNAKEIASDGFYNRGAISGIEHDVEQIQNSDVTFLDYSYNNKAVAQDSDAISGVFADIGNVFDSDVTINANTSDNVARAKGYGDAISGVYVDIYNMQNSNATIFAQSNDNKANAVNGSAIAGNKVLVQNSDSDSTVSVFLEAEKNKASSDYGEAVIDNVVDVNGDANVVFLP